jgi:hypothetical protein
MLQPHPYLQIITPYIQITPSHHLYSISVDMKRKCEASATAATDSKQEDDPILGHVNACLPHVLSRIVMEYLAEQHITLFDLELNACWSDALFWFQTADSEIRACRADPDPTIWWNIHILGFPEQARLDTEEEEVESYKWGEKMSSINNQAPFHHGWLWCPVPQKRVQCMYKVESDTGIAVWVGYKYGITRRCKTRFMVPHRVIGFTFDYDDKANCGVFVYLLVDGTLMWRYWSESNDRRQTMIEPTYACFQSPDLSSLMRPRLSVSLEHNRILLCGWNTESERMRFFLIPPTVSEETPIQYASSSSPWCSAFRLQDDM